MAIEDSLADLQNQWKETFQKTLPTAAKSKSPAQTKWPVTLDHCFARIILDKVMGVDTPWTQKIKPPAYKNMTRDQLEECIALGNQILNGDVNLVELDNESLTVRGKALKPENKKRELEEDDGKEEDSVKPKKKTIEVTKEKPHTSDIPSLITSISQSNKTTFQKRVLSLLCQIPRGRFTTYAAVSAFLRSSPRAVGGALKNNTWAPHVPCHRVLAADGGLGGFHGSWGRNGEAGKNDDKKLALLREEGIKFDGKGRAVGSVWSEFTT